MRPRFSLMSALMMFAALSSVMVLNTIPGLQTVETHGEGSFYMLLTEHEYGWPWIYKTELANSVRNDLDYQAGFSWSALAFNVAVAMGVAVGSAASTELILCVSRRLASRARSPATHS